MADDDLENKPTEEQSPIRSAFLRSWAQADALAGGTGGAGAEPELVRGAYLSRLARETVRKRGDNVVGSEETGGAVLRGIYAARSLVGETRGPRPRPAAPAARKKAVPAKKAALKRKAKAAAPKRKAAVSRPKAAKKAAAKRVAKKKARRR